MSTMSEVAGERKVGAHPRILAILALSALVVGLFFFVRSVYYAISDAWLAPIMLSPDNDIVLEINVKLNEQIFEHDKLQHDLVRIDDDLQGVDDAIGRLHALDKDGREAMSWTSKATKEQAASYNEQLQSLQHQKEMLAGMINSENDMLVSAHKNAHAGLISAQDEEREVQIMSQLQLTMAQNDRELSETKVMAGQLSLAATALTDPQGGNARAKSQIAFGLIPEFATAADRDVRVELEIIKLEAEHRSLIAERATAIEGVTRMEEIFKQLKARPVYRAIQARTDVAFVPYTQLDGVEAGAELIDCTLVFFSCHVVGHVSEVLSGEVVAQDPWSDIARGQYAILDLTDREASKEKVLRARRIKH